LCVEVEGPVWGGGEGGVALADVVERHFAIDVENGAWGGCMERPKVRLASLAH